MINKATHSQVAAKFKVRTHLVSRLVRAFKKDCGFVRAIREREELRSTKASQVVEAANDIVATHKNIWRAAQVAECVKSKHGKEVSNGYVAAVLRTCLKMRYRKVKRVPFQGNSERCIVQRQQYGKYMLKLMSSGRRILNIDET